MKKAAWIVVVLGVVCQVAMADPAAANRIAHSKQLQPVSEAHFKQQYQALANKPAGSQHYAQYLKRWRAAKADGFVLDVNTFVQTEG